MDLNVLDFKQMLCSKEAFNVLNALYEAGIKDDMLAKLNVANENVKCSVRTPNGMTEN